MQRGEPRALSRRRLVHPASLMEALHPTEGHGKEHEDHELKHAATAKKKLRKS